MNISEKITNNIKISVNPVFIPAEQTPMDGRNYFAYTITITNLGEEWAKLLNRHWIIIDSEGNTEEVIGEGVVGYFPELEKDQSFTYTSYCPITTDWGTMEGFYQFIRRNGSLFDVEVPRFYLISPYAKMIVDDK